MKWVFFSVLALAILDVGLVQYHIRKGDDVFAPGLLVVILVPLLVYTGALVYVAIKKDLPDKWPVMTHLLLLPAYLFLLLHVIFLFVNLMNYLK